MVQRLLSGQHLLRDPSAVVSCELLESYHLSVSVAIADVQSCSVTMRCLCETPALSLPRFGRLGCSER
jgi:hypothetical protein